MSPIAIADLTQGYSTSDPKVFPAVDADIRLRKLWARHGDPQSSQYSNPELDCLSALVRYNARTHCDELAYLVPCGSDFESVTWQRFDILTDIAASHYAEAFRKEIETGNDNFAQPTIALLGSGNTFQYWVTQVGLCKVGVRILLLSDKNAEVARDHLLNVCNASGMVAEQRYLEAVETLGMTTIPLFKVDLNEDRTPSSDFLQFRSNDVWNQHAMIIHSSGSTGLPKPIIHTNRSTMLIARMYRLFQSFVVENWYLCFPLFHIAGVSIILGGIPSALPTSFPPETWPPSPGSIMTAWRKLEEIGQPVDCLHCAPSVIEDLCEYFSMDSEPEFSPLLKLKILQPGGAALSPSLLKKLTGLGVNVKTTYGSTEIGPPYRTIPDVKTNPSCYHVRSLYPDNKLVQMEPQGGGLFECVVYKGFEPAAELWESSEAPNPYRTNDLFFEDPPGSGSFVLQGRKDDILVHSNGEKTNALPLQMAIEESHFDINKVIVFGTDQPCTSAIIELAKGSSFNEEVVLQAISTACEPFPSFSRLDRSTVMILSETESLPITPKGNVRRKEVWNIYGDRINQLYADLMDGGPKAEVVNDMTHFNDTDFVRHCVSTVSGLPLDTIQDTSSFYDLGLNSQVAVRLRPLLTHRFGKFPLMFIFEYPSALELTQRFKKLEKPSGPQSSGRQFAWIQDAISRYTDEIKSWTMQPAASNKEDGGEVVYLTGATGALGNAMLAEFVANDKITKVYCAIRGENADGRLAKQLQDRGYGLEVCHSDKLIAVPYDMTSPELGLEKAQYETLASEVTTIVHNAWKMDFNQQVNMFEGDCLASTLNLMRFCRTSVQKTFALTSSVATNMGKAAHDQVVQEAPIVNDPSLALETGYAQSKFIVEVVSQAFAEITGTPVRICRVGQLCGHTTLGSWNTSEMFPIMIATGLNYLNAMPNFAQQEVNWLPVDICANAINTILTTPNPSSYTVHNLVNPSTVPWPTFLKSLQSASGIDFERISMQDWVSKLQKLSEEKDGVPGAKLLGFFEGMCGEEGEQGESRFETKGTQYLVPKLRESKAVDEELLRLYLEKWRRDGFI